VGTLTIRLQHTQPDILNGQLWQTLIAWGKGGGGGGDKTMSG